MLYAKPICVHLTKCPPRLVLDHQYVYLEVLNWMSFERMNTYVMNFDLENNSTKKKAKWQKMTVTETLLKHGGYIHKILLV